MKWTVGRRITAGFAVVLALMAVVAAVGAYALGRAARAYEAALHEEQQVLIPTLQARDEFQRANLDYVFVLLDGDERWAESRDSTAALARQLLTGLRDSAATPETRRGWEESLQLLARWDAAARRSMLAARAGRQAEALLVRDSAVAPVRDSLRASMMNGMREAQRVAAAYERDANDVSDGMRVTLALAAGAALALGILAAVLLNRAVTAPLRETSSVLASTAAEILAATTQQAAGAAESSAAVAETVTTVDEVAQTSEQAAQRARSVAEMAERAAEIAKSGRKAVDDSVVGMAGVREQVEDTAERIVALAEQAQAIGEITATVSEIAEQTNLLALNAAVEAARAGEHGRGFAVVAGEIRSLAEQSKRATVQVRQILGEIQRATGAAVLATENGTRQVSAGAEQITAAGETIRALADAVAGASQAAAQIVASAGQQAAGMMQIRQAMENIHEATQQNLASSRQAEQAAQDLSSMGGRLVGLIGGEVDEPTAIARR